MGLLDGMFAPQVDPKKAHLAALAHLLETAATTPDANSQALIDHAANYKPFPSGGISQNSPDPSLLSQYQQTPQTTDAAPDIRGMLNSQDAGFMDFLSKRAADQPASAPQAPGASVDDVRGMLNGYDADLNKRLDDAAAAQNAPPGDRALREFLKRRQSDAADPAIEPQTPFGGATFGGNTFGGNPWQTSVENAPAPDPQAPNPWQTSVQQAPDPVQPTAAPTPAAKPSPAPAPSQASQVAPKAEGTQRESSIWERLSALGHGYTNGGLLGGLGDAIGGVSRQDQTQNMTMEALIRKGIDPATARAVAQNPELSKTVIPQLFQNPQFSDIGTDQFGNAIKGWINPVQQTTRPADLSGNLPGAPGAAGAPVGVQDVNQLTQKLNLGLGGKELYGQLDPTTQSEVKALIEGRLPITNPQRAGPRFQMLMAIASRVDPKFDATTYAMRQELRKNLEGYGKGGQEATAANTAVEHLSELSDLGGKLNNVGGAWILNKPINEAQGAYRWLNGDNRPNTFNALRDLAVSEVDKFYKATGGAAAEREAMIDQIKSTSTPQQIQGVIATMATSMTGKVSELERRWANGMGPSVEPLNVLSPESKQKVQMLRQRAGLNSGETASAATGGAPPQAIPMPSVGTMLQGYRFKGGNPALPASWERA